MQRRTRLFPILPIAIVIAAVAPATRAAELGEARVSSHIGQQLVADIELTALDDPHAKLEVRLADPEVYSGAGIALPPALSTLSLSVMRRDGRQFLHATTLRPVDADHLHLYLELADHGQHVVRLATLWLTPDPNPAPLAPPVPAVRPAPRSRPAEAPATPSEPAPAQAPARVSEPAPPRAEHPPHAPPALPLPLPLHLPLHRAAPAACVPQDGDAQACTALGARNTELRTRIGQLEDRVKGLQARLGVAAAGEGAKPVTPAARPARAPQPSEPAPAADAKPPEAKPEAKPEPKPTPPAGPKPISSIKPLVAHKPKTAPPDDDLPLGAIGAGLALLAVAGAAVALSRARSKRARKAGVPGGPGLLDKLRRRFGKGTGARAAAAARVEPVDEAVAGPGLE